MNTLVICDGKAPPKSLFNNMLAWADLLIAADGGANIARSLGAIPDFIIGDLDSYDEQEGDTFKVIHKPSQYANDLEKALEFAIQKKASQVKVLAATGLRLDHTLKNLSVLKQFDKKFQHLSFADEHGTIQLLPRKFSKEIPVHTPVSLFPLSGKVAGITTQGLKYPLKNDFLENGVRDGTSNTVVSSPVTISYREGDLLLFIAK